MAVNVVQDTTTQPVDTADAELQSVRFSLYARALSLLGTACLLAENDKQLDLRICSRSIVECALHMAAADSGPVYLAALKDDDLASRRSRAKAFRKRQPTVDDASLRLLNDFLDQDVGKPKILKPTEIAEGSEFPRLAHGYREVSADAAHVTLASLMRHVVDNGEGANTCMVDPEVTAEELQETLVMISLSILICTFLLARTVSNGDAIAERFADLQLRYQALRKM